MLKFKTILLWIAFIFLAIEHLFLFTSTTYLIFRMVPIMAMIIWFVISLFYKSNFKINPSKVTKKNAWILKFVRPIASLLIILGAAAKLMRWPYSDIPLVIGIGCMALYYSALNYVVEQNKDYLPDIIDDNLE